MSPLLSRKKTGFLLLAGLVDLSFAAGQHRGYPVEQVIMTPATITQAVTLSIGNPASEITFSVVRTGMVPADVQASDTATTPPPSTIATPVPVSDSNNAGSVSSNDLLIQPFSLPTQQAVMTQVPCVSACLQEGLIASAVGTCGLGPISVIDNACACLSAPLAALHALTNCASAACTGIAAGSSGLAQDLAAVTYLYNDYCTTAVGAAALANAVASAQAVQVTVAAEPSTVTVTASSSSDAAVVTVTASTSSGTASVTMSSGDISSGDAGSTSSGNGTLTSTNVTVTAGVNGTFDGNGPLTAPSTFTETGITAGVASTTTAVDAATSKTTKSQAALEMPRKPEIAIISLAFALTLPLFIL